MTEEQKRLKAFMLDNFDFDSLKESGFWPKGMRKDDYQGQADRVCQFFGHKSVYEYRSVQIRDVHETDTTLTGRFADTVDDKGYHKGEGFHLSLMPPTDFICPHCTLEQDANDYKAFRNRGDAIVKCRGCKRRILLFECPMSGGLTVSEL